MVNDYGTSLIVSPGVEMGDIEARASLPEGPGYSATGEQRAALEAAFFSLGYSDEYHDQHVNHDTAFSYSAFWGCVQVISQSLAGLGWHAYEKKEGSPRFRFPIEDDIAWTLGLQANPEMTAFTWREVMLKDALVGGNGYSEIERTRSGKFLWLWRLDPDRVTPQRDERGRLYYEIDNGPGEDPTLLPPENMFHLKGPSPDGLVGWDVVNLAKRAIKLGMAEERFGCDFFGRGPMPGGMVTVPGNMTKEQRREFRRSFEEVYSGPRNAHRIVVLSNQVKFDPSHLPNDSAQFLESRAFQALEICRFFRVPPHKLADLTRATFSNIEEQEREFVTDCLLPWARRLESEADIKAFGLINRGRRFTRLNLDALMRGNSATQTDTVTKKVNSAVFTVNEAREYFELNPIEGGDTPLVQGAMAPLERILEEPEPAPPPAPPKAPGEPPPPDEPPESLLAPFQTLFADLYQRVLDGEDSKATQAAKNGELQNWAARNYREDGPGAPPRLAKRLLPLVEAFLAACRLQASAPVLASLLATDHATASLLSVSEYGGVNRGRAAAQAEAHVKLLWGSATKGD